MIRPLAALIELAGYAAIAACIYLINPVLLIGAVGGLAVVFGNALARRGPE